MRNNRRLLRIRNHGLDHQLGGIKRRTLHTRIQQITRRGFIRHNRNGDHILPTGSAISGNLQFSSWVGTNDSSGVTEISPSVISQRSPPVLQIR